MTKPIVKRLFYQLGRRSRDGVRCEAAVAETTARWRIHRGSDIRCDLHALFSVDGNFFCKRHAGDYLLKHLCVGDALVEKPTKGHKK